MATGTVGVIVKRRITVASLTGRVNVSWKVVAGEIWSPVF